MLGSVRREMEIINRLNRNFIIEKYINWNKNLLDLRLEIVEKWLVNLKIDY